VFFRISFIWREKAGKACHTNTFRCPLTARLTAHDGGKTKRPAAGSVPVCGLMSGYLFRFPQYFLTAHLTAQKIQPGFQDMQIDSLTKSRNLKQCSVKMNLEQKTTCLCKLDELFALMCYRYDDMSAEIDMNRQSANGLSFRSGIYFFPI
jgi:hypothetical protein